MIEGINGKGLLAALDDGRTSVVATCPTCDREEEFDNSAMARAWLTGHIQEEHPDDLPAFGGSEE